MSPLRSSPRPTGRRRIFVVLAVLASVVASLAVATGLPSPAAQAQTGQCVTATNSQHAGAGRAVWFLLYWAAGSYDNLGFSGTATTSLQSNGSGAWTLVPNCPPPTSTTSSSSTTSIPGGGRPPLEQRYTAIYETDAGLANHTVYRPQDLNAVADDMPIVVWGNGGCFSDGTGFQNFLRPLAAHGVLVIANGTPGGLGTTTSQMLIDAVNWAVAENTRAGSKYQGRLDVNAISAQGQSCGGIEAVNAAGNARVRSTVLWNSGLFNGGDKSALGRLHGPTAWFTGGTSDIAYANTVDDYGRVPASVPAVMGHYGNVGHGGLFFGDAATIQNMVNVAADWLDASLYGNAAARRQFVGANCGLCTGTPWVMTSKNW